MDLAFPSTCSLLHCVSIIILDVSLKMIFKSLICELICSPLVLMFNSLEKMLPSEIFDHPENIRGHLDLKWFLKSAPEKPLTEIIQAC